MKRVLVLGGSGFIGSAIVPLLLERGYGVRCLLRATSDVSRIAGLSWERALGDIRDAESVREAAVGCWGIVHLAGVSSWDLIDSPMMRDVVVDGTRNVLHAGRQASARIVFVSSAATINGSDEPRVWDESATWCLPEREFGYAVAKREAEADCRRAAAGGLRVTIVNPGEVYGARDVGLITASTLVDFARNWPMMVTRGGIGVVHLDDVAVGIVRALEDGKAGERYILSGENVTIRRLAELTRTCLSQGNKPIVEVPSRALFAMAKVGKKLGAKLPFNPKVLPYATRYWFMDAGKARRDLGLEFRPARDAIGSSVAWLRRAGHVA